MAVMAIVNWKGEADEQQNPSISGKNALGAKRPLSELWESSGVFSEQLSEFEIPFSEWHPTT